MITGKGINSNRSVEPAVGNDPATCDYVQNSQAHVRIKLPHVVIVRAPGLLPMLYRPVELAEDLGVSDRVVREWILKDLPHQRDERGHLWIDGREVALWVSGLRNSGTTPKLAEDEAYCLPCHKPVKLVNPTQTKRGKQIMLHSRCPNCGTSIHRGKRNDQSD